MTAPDGWDKKGLYEFRVLVARSTIIFVAVAIRFLCKLSRQENRFGWDDFWILVAFCLNYTMEGTTFWGLIRSHGGMSVAQLAKGGDLRSTQDFLLAEDIGSMVWYLVVMSICFSILCFYLRFFSLEDNFRRNSWVLFAITGVWGVGGALGSILLCIPPSNFWKMKDLDKCGSYNVFLMSTSILEIVITTAILALPIHPILSLTLSLRTRLSILSIFLLGAFVILSAILRLALVYNPGARTPDFLKVMVWSDIHVTAAIVCACLPIYQPLWTQLAVVSKTMLSYPQRLLTNRLRSRRTGSVTHSESERADKRSIDSSSHLPHKAEDHIEEARKTNGVIMLREYELWEKSQDV